MEDKVFFPIILHRIFHSQLRLLSLFARLEQILKLDYGHTRTVAREDSGTDRRMDGWTDGQWDGELNKVRSTRTRLHCCCCCCCGVISSTFPLGTRRSHVVARWTKPDNARGALRRAAVK